ncbi:N-acetylglucosamine-6-phosphate deacetylase [Pseudaminobacter arsenicus]|uniref:N-acetylglucosamine-6-phosphate deacetylase n=1 Tax=Borborobacter arsenicus TaxID=1851146 RepID=A0A432UZV1_9HYPH|nr:N-acetylglucosamine-6-phosphate deacetylase [Pseudaminobacter arsenicus]RUM95440.1 N-acetylglucosamine-6-phosphate deacetylase [Pseudaminobacter arsenicus]
MRNAFALSGARIFDGETWHDNAALVVRDGSIHGIMRDADADITCIDLGGGIITPGFIDLQVNGGGGIMLNDDPSLETIRTICAAHAPFGTTALLPTLITDTREITASAIEAGAQAARQKVPGFLGLHLEGPHLSLARKGAHDPALIRPMDDEDQAALIAARQKLPVLLTTLAPESVALHRIEALSAADVVVSLGHTDTSYAQALDVVLAGASMATHLFNAMSQLGSREPGLAGAVLDSGTLWAGLIADGIHVDPATIAIALRAKQEPARIFLVTDAMATIGTDLQSFMLNGREIRRENGRLTLDDGTLAGADLDMISAVRFIHETIGLELGEALRMASLYPAQAVGQGNRLGRFEPGTAANILHLSDALEVQRVWIDGKQAA